MKGENLQTLCLKLSALVENDYWSKVLIISMNGGIVKVIDGVLYKEIGKAWVRVPEFGTKLGKNELGFVFEIGTGGK